MGKRFTPYLIGMYNYYPNLLGKMSNTCLPYGRTPVAAVGTMDMHAQVQEHQEGRLNKVVQFIKVKDWKHNLVVPNTHSQYERLHSLCEM